MTKQEQIEEMAQIIFNSKYKNDYISPLKGANELYNAGYRKIPENAVVITNEEYKMLKYLEKYHITCEDVSEYIALARKETAKKLLQELYNEAVQYGKTTVGIEWMAQKYGVEVKE